MLTATDSSESARGNRVKRTVALATDGRTRDWHLMAWRPRGQLFRSSTRPMTTHAPQQTRRSLDRKPYARDCRALRRDERDAFRLTAAITHFRSTDFPSLRTGFLDPFQRWRSFCTVEFHLEVGMLLSVAA